MSTLDEIFAGPRGHGSKGCRVCGRTVAVAVTVQIRRTHDNGRYMTGEGTAKSKQWSLCDEHGAQGYTAATTVLYEMEPR